MINIIYFHFISIFNTFIVWLEFLSKLQYTKLLNFNAHNLFHYSNMKTLKTTLLLGAAYLLTVGKLMAIDPSDTRMLSQPAISDHLVAFIYAEDLWVANIDGANPKRLTVDHGVESNPHFSPDGQTIAFSAQYDGNMDVFVVPVNGGVPKRLTWHPGNDFARGFSPDGKNVLFGSRRSVFTNRYVQLFTVPVGGGQAKQLVIPNAWRASYSPGGKHMAYTPIPERSNQWKNYRGGTISNIIIFSFDDHSINRVPQPAGGCNDTDPMWIGDKIYFRSDRGGEYNLYSYDNASKAITAITQFKDFPIISASKSNKYIVFEQAGFLHQYDISANAINKITIGIATDLLELRPRYVSNQRYIRSASISPSGARAVFDFRGEIITVPAEKGDPRNLTQSPGAHDKYPSWSPDGKSIAYFSDGSGEYKLHIKPQDNSNGSRTISLTGTGFYAYIHWSPDGKKLCFVDNGRNLYLMDVASGSTKKIDTDDMYFPGAFRDLFGDWSEDGKWITYTKITNTNFERVYLYSVDQGMSFGITDGLSDASLPVFDPSGKYLYFVASTDAGPNVNWFDQSNQDISSTYNIYLATLRNDIFSPLAKESDEESGEDKPKEDVSKNDKKDKGKKEAAKSEKDWQIDITGIENRIVNLPVSPGQYFNLTSHKEGQLLYISAPPNFNGDSHLHKYDLSKRKDEQVMAADNIIVAAGGEKMLYRKGNNWGISGAGKKPDPEKGKLNTGQIEIKIDPMQEWQNIFEESWRINRDYFYDPGMHGADWPAMKTKYEQFLPHLTCRNDLNRVIQWMCSELAVGHHRLTNFGDRLHNPKRVSGGLLGANYKVENNLYRLSKIFGGLNWTPNLRSPLTEPGVNAKVGDYILAVNGKNITAAENLYSFFENTAGKIVTLTIGPDPNGDGSRAVKVVPLANEYALRNRDWVEGNLKKVDEATNGQVAYVYVPNTAYAGHQYFKRYFYPQANKKAIIIDERFNGGGQIADYYINILTNPYQSYWNFRYGNDLKTPSASIQGPKVMLIDETAGSGGDMLPWMFRKFKVGTLVGKRTWGGLVGILGFPEFLDGGGVTAPNVAIWTKDGFIVENAGVPPDVEVEQNPADVIKGKDPQLEKAIEIVMEELKRNPQNPPKRPPYPSRVKK